MTTPQRIAVFAAFITVVSSALPTGLTQLEGGARSLYLGLMAVYLCLMMAVMLPWILGRRACRDRRWLHGYFGVQILLYVGAELLARGEYITYLATMPLAGQMVSDYGQGKGWRWPALATLTLFLAVCLVKGYFLEGVFFLYWLGPIAGAFIFMFAFTWLATQAEIRRQESEHLATELAAANEQLREQNEAIERLTRERELTRVSRELHDSLGHSLTTLAVQLEAALALPDRNDERAVRALERARVLGQSALQDVRDAVRTLRSPIVQRPLAERLRELITLGADTPLVVEFEVVGEPRALGPDVDQALFRVMQEGLTNVRRHAQAQRVEVCLDFSQQGKVRLSLADDGRGMAPDASGTGSGLPGLRERLASFGGTVQAESRVLGGFRLAVEVPA